jgi:ligand-binding sensor domain-containing protein
MALQSSGAISLSDIQTEFGGSSPTSLSEYYRGGSNVINASVNNSIPTSGAISLTDFYGTEGVLASSFTRIGSVGNASINLQKAADPYRWVFIVMQDMQGPQLSTLSTPSANGSAMSTAVNDNSGALNDGHRLGMFYANIPTGTSVTFSNMTLSAAVYEITGIQSISSNLNVFTTDAVTSSSANSWAIAGLVTNFADAGSNTVPTNMTSGGGGGAALHGYDADMGATSVTYTFGNPGNPVILRKTVTCEFDW